MPDSVVDDIMDHVTPAKCSCAKLWKCLRKDLSGRFYIVTHEPPMEKKDRLHLEGMITRWEYDTYDKNGPK